MIVREDIVPHLQAGMAQPRAIGPADQMLTKLGGTKAGRIDRSVRDNVVNLTTRETNVRKLTVREAT